MNRKIVLSLLSIVVVLGMVGGATYAYFSDVGTSINNVFASGTFDLKLTDNNQTALDDVSETWTGISMAPGGASVSATLYLKNTGTVAGDHVHFKAANTLTDIAPSESNGSMAKHLKIVAMTYDGADILSLVPETNANGYKDLEDLQSGGDGMILGSLTDLNNNHPLFMSVQLASDADNTYQGDQVVTVFTATLHQNASQ